MRGPTAFSLAILLMGATVATRAQAPAPEAAYVVRGHQAEVHQQALNQRLDRFYTSLSKQLQHEAPDLLATLAPLLATLTPPPPIAYGYEILPRIVSDAPPGPATKPHVVNFSWRWSDTLISREMTNLERLESDLATASLKPAEGKRAAYETIVADYKKAVDRRRLIDADINYN